MILYGIAGERIEAGQLVYIDAGGVLRVATIPAIGDPYPADDEPPDEPAIVEGDK